MTSGQEGAKLAFATIFSNLGGTLLFVFVIISCLGTLNGLMLGCTRGLYSIAVRNQGPHPRMFSQIDEATNMPTNSAIGGLLLSAFWLLFFYGANLTEPWFGFFCFDSSELPIVTIYAMYLPIFFRMRKETGLSAFKRVTMPMLASLGSLFMIYAACFAHGMAVVAYLIIFLAFMIPATLFVRKNNSSGR
ncbi:hypothetical protein MASR1M90_01390 [Desulfovibrionales bacterium]